MLGGQKRGFIRTPPVYGPDPMNVVQLRKFGALQHLTGGKHPGILYKMHPSQ